MIKVAIVGAGLSGLISALILSKKAGVNVTVFEKGHSYSDRLLDKEANMLHGIGGAGTLSGGKFCFPPASSGVWKKTGLTVSNFIYFANAYLSELVDKSIVETVLMAHYNKITKTGIMNKKFESKLLLEHEMRHFINTLLAKLETQNVDIRTNTDFAGFSKTENAVIVIHRCESGELRKELFDYVIIATGRSSASEINEWFHDNYITQVSPDLGIRVSIENNENMIFSHHGQDVKLKANYNNISARTFCVCSGGDSTLIKYGGQQYYDGHFRDVLSSTVNFGILVRNKTIVGVNNAISFCGELNSFIGKGISLKDTVNYGSKFLTSQSKFGYVFEIINHFVIQMQKDGFLSSNLDKYQVFMPSVDRLNPVISTNRFFETAMRNIYVVGDAVGISRGFIQSMWSAHYASENILWKIASVEYTGRKAA